MNFNLNTCNYMQVLSAARKNKSVSQVKLKFIQDSLYFFL